MRKKSYLYSGALLFFLVIVAFALNRGLVRGIVQDGDVTLSTNTSQITTGQTIGQVGRTLEVLVDQIEDGQAVARSYREAPEIDGVILLDRGEPGDWLTATVTGGYGTDLTATVVG